jgi:hypothetical protein
VVCCTFHLEPYIKPVISVIRDTIICLCFPYDMFAIADATHERKQNE